MDTYGGHEAPGAVVRAAARMSRQGVANVLLVGDVALLQDQLGLIPYDPMTLRLVPGGAAFPRRPGDTRAQADAARVGLPVALQLLRDGEADVLVTASDPELVRELAVQYLPMLAGARAVAAAAVVPTMPRPGQDEPLALLLDVSGRRTPSADDLVQFAVMGSAWARAISGVAEPAVALLSTGTLPGDGPPEVVAAHQRLKTMTGMKFIGNLRATELSRGLADVVVTDGLVGHTVHGLLEGLTDMTVEAARYAWKAKMTWRVGLRLLSQGVGMLRKVSEFKEYGGAPLLGMEHLILVASPESREAAFENALRLAQKCHLRGLQKELQVAMGRTFSGLSLAADPGSAPVAGPGPALAPALAPAPVPALALAADSEAATKRGRR